MNAWSAATSTVRNIAQNALVMIVSTTGCKHMSDNLTDLKLSNSRRIQALSAKGRQIQGLPDAYMMRMLEHLCGDALPEIQAAHELFTAETLDNAEKALREQTLLGNVPGVRT
jgi:hypothetical protein